MEYIADNRTLLMINQNEVIPMFRSTFLRKALTASLMSLLCGSFAFAAENPFWDFSIYGTKDPKQLLQKSIDSESAAEKVRIRTYVAAVAPQTAEGLLSRAWISDYEGKKEESNRLYDECVQRFPTSITCLNNAISVHPDDMSLRQRYLDLAPEAFDYAPVRDYFTTLGKIGKKDEQKAFIAQMKERFSGKWISDFMSSLEAAERGDRDAQRAALRRAIAIGDQPPFFVYQDLIRLETGYFFQGGGNRIDLAIELVVQYLKETQRFDEYAPWEYLMDDFAGAAATKVQILREFVRIYDMAQGNGARLRPIPVEALDAVNNRGESNTHSQLGPWLKQFRARFESRRASEPAVDASLLWFETATDAPLQALAPRWQQLVANALTEKDASSFAVSALSALSDFRGDCSFALRLAAGWDQRFAGNVSYQRNALETSLCANDLASARQHLDAVARFDPGQSAADRSDRMRVAQAEAQAKAWNEHELHNPFIKQWDKKNDGQVALNIVFASGSATIPPQYAEPLSQLARLLKENGAEDYQFDIAGHTDSRGSAALNQKLSERRAEALVGYLVAKAGIERGRLTYTGYGSSVPVASNETAAGMQQNRRVEITPRANLRQPVLAQVGTPEGSVALSPDGRVLATRDALWDVKTRLKLRDLPAARLKRMDFLPNGRSLVRLIETDWPSSSERMLEVIDVASGLVMRRQLVKAAEDFSISPDGRKLAIINNGQLLIYALPALQLRNQHMISVLASVGRVAWLGNDRIAATARYSGEKLHLLDADTLAIIKIFDDIDYVHTLGVSRSGKYLAAITNEGGTLHVWDTKSWEHKSQSLGVYADRFVFHPFEEKALINQWNGSERKTRLLDLDTMSVVKTFDGSFTTAFAPDGRSFFFAGKEYDFATFNYKPWTALEVANDGASFGTWLPEAGQFTTEYDKDSDLWDAASGRQIDKLVGLRECGKIPGSPTLFWKCGDDNKTEMVERGIWRVIPNPRGFKLRDTQSVEQETASRMVIFERDPAPRAGRVAKGGKLSIVDRPSGRTLATHPILLRLEDAVYSDDDTLHSGDVRTAVDSTGRYLAVSVWWKEHWGYPALSGKQVWLFDLENGNEIDHISLNPRAEGIAFAPGKAPLLRISFDTYTGVYALGSRTWGKNEPWSAKETLHAEEGRFKVVTLGEKLTLLDSNGPERYLFLRKEPSGVALFTAQNLMLVYYGSGEFDYYDLKTLSRRLTLHAKRKGEWLAYAPSGEFSASLNGTEGYYWSLGEKYIPFGALRERFELPGVIARQLQNVAKGTAAAPVALAATSLRQDKDNSQSNSGNTSSESIEADLFMPPFSLRLINPPATSSEAKLTLRVGITKLRAVGVEPEVELNINGQQVNTRALKRVSENKSCNDAKEKINCEQIIELPINLIDGRNDVAVSLLYRSARLETKTSVIELKRAQSAGREKPRLWIFAAGVSEYADSSQNLKFADRDADELSKMFKSQEGKLYSQVNTKVLTNRQVLKGTLDNELIRFLRQAAEQDLIVILLAGHGLQDNDQTLYYATHDTTLEEAFSGMEVARIHGILRNRPANQKAILLLDICHAGALGETQRSTVNSGDAIKLLRQGTGITMLSSSTGRELSNESIDFLGGHGAFTAAAIEGLMGAADRESGNRDGIVTIVELSLYIQRRVSELTNNTQHSTMSLNGQDYPLATAQ